MEKTSNIPDLAEESASRYEKLIFRITPDIILKIILNFMFHFANVFSGLSPFGIGFFVGTFKADSWIGCFGASVIGAFLSLGKKSWVYIATIILMTVIMGVTDLAKKTIVRAIFSGTIFFIFSCARIIAGDFILYDIFEAALESIILSSYVIIFSNGFSVIKNIRKKNYITTAQTLAALVLIATFSMTLCRIPNIFSINIGYVFSMLVLYIFCLEGCRGAGIITAVIFGTVSILKTDSHFAIMQTYTFGALAACCLKRYGKAGIILGFSFAYVLVSMIIMKESEIITGIYSAIAASIIFLCLPAAFIKKLSLLSLVHVSNGVTKVSKGYDFSEKCAERLMDMSKSFHELSDVYLSPPSGGDFGNGYVRLMFSSLSCKVCNGCSSKNKCLGTDARPYPYMYRVLNDAISTGSVSVANLPKELKDICHRTDSFVQEFNYRLELMKTERRWMSRINESRRLISDQLCAVADSVENESRRCLMKNDSELEEKLYSLLDDKGINPLKIEAFIENSGDYTVAVTVRDKLSGKNTALLIADSITDATNVDTVISKIKKSGENTVYYFSPGKQYNASFGYASKPKSGEKVSGDSFNVIFADSTNIVMALSDGMGSGKEASEESMETINLLEKFIHAGFDCDTAVRLINSSLLLKSSRDTFSTIDICSINLSKAALTFTKLGASTAYIKSEDKITTVSASALPAGILRDVEIEKHMLPINGNMLVVLMSDGVGDIALKNKKHEGWIENELKSVTSDNPQIIAAKLLDKAYRLENKVTHDDMTVLVSCISRM